MIRKLFLILCVLFLYSSSFAGITDTISGVIARKNAVTCDDTLMYSQTGIGAGSDIRATPLNYRVGNTFLTTESHLFCKIEVYLKSDDATQPDGDLWVELLDTTGADGLPTGSVLATSDILDANTLTTDMAIYTFTFTGVNLITLTNAHYYAFALNGDYAINGTNFAVIQIENSGSAYSNGDLVRENSVGAWSFLEENDDDARFYIYK